MMLHDVLVESQSSCAAETREAKDIMIWVTIC